MSVESMEATDQQQSLMERVRDFAQSKLAILGSTAMAAFGVAGMETAPAGATESGAPLSPLQMAYDGNYYYGNNIDTNGTGIFDLRKMEIGKHTFVKLGVCHPGNPNSSVRHKALEDSLRGELTVSCTKKNGKYETNFVPRRYVGYLPAARSMNFVPVLDQIGNTAAASVGINQHGTPTHVEIDINKARHLATATILYEKDLALGENDLKELQISIQKGGVATANPPVYY